MKYVAIAIIPAFDWSSRVTSSTFHTRTLLSAEHVARRSPEGENRHEYTTPLCPRRINLEPAAQDFWHKVGEVFYVAPKRLEGPLFECGFCLGWGKVL